MKRGLFIPGKRPKPPKTKGPAELYWEEFTAKAIEKGFTKKVAGDLAYMNKKGKYIKLLSTVGGILTYYDETTNQQHQIYRKAI